jgi:ferredoxin
MPNVIYYRKKCIGCGVCYEMQPELWRMSRKDGKSTLLRSIQNKNTYVLELNQHTHEKTQETANACPVKIIKVT